MNFRTKIDIKTSEKKINHEQNLLLIGSCFTIEIGEILAKKGFKLQVNPFGIQYNPLSIEKCIKEISDKKIYSENNLFFHEGKYHSFMHHSTFSNANKEECLNAIQQKIENTKLNEIDVIIITLGTAWIYRLASTNEVVSNCHKLPEQQFVRSRISIKECVASLDNMIQSLKQQNPDIHIIFTVSPIRHFRDGAIENSLSKSTLLLSIDEIKKSYPDIDYFPSYEILIDELRDYRFYATDMNHPSCVAIEYIYERFAETYFSSQTMNVAKTKEKEWKHQHHKQLL